MLEILDLGAGELHPFLSNDYTAREVILHHFSMVEFNEFLHLQLECLVVDDQEVGLASYELLLVSLNDEGNSHFLHLVPPFDFIFEILRSDPVEFVDYSLEMGLEIPGLAKGFSPLFLPQSVLLDELDFVSQNHEVLFVSNF